MGYYDLIKLDPGFQIIFDTNHTIKINSSFSDILSLFESYEKGAGDKLKKFIDDAEIKYNLAVKSLMYQPVERNKDKHCYIGRMTQELFKSSNFF